MARGLAELRWEELDLSALDRSRLRDYSGPFPRAVQTRLQPALADKR